MCRHGVIQNRGGLFMHEIGFDGGTDGCRERDIDGWMGFNPGQSSDVLMDG